MTLQEKTSRQERYTRLVTQAKRSYPRTGDLIWCDACRDEINLWTYWQGRGCLNPDLLLVGQDWGNPNSKPGQTCLRNIQQHRPYLEGNTFPSDRNLAVLFQNALGIDISVPDRRLFFTNLVLGYRTRTNTGPLSSSQFSHDLEHFKTLVSILRPKLVICLGQKTFTGALRAFEEQASFPDGYTAALNAGTNYRDIDGIRFYAMAHCGNYGCKNRGGNVAAGLKLQVEDWKQIKAFC